VTHRKVPDGANREYLKSQNPTEGGEKGGLGAVKEAVNAFSDSSDEQRNMLVGLLGLFENVVVSTIKYQACVGSNKATYFLRTGVRHGVETTWAGPGV
jgi:hypothetical protein